MLRKNMQQFNLAIIRMVQLLVLLGLYGAR